VEADVGVEDTPQIERTTDQDEEDRQDDRELDQALTAPFALLRPSSTAIIGATRHPCADHLHRLCPPPCGEPCSGARPPSTGGAIASGAMVTVMVPSGRTT
jgi:hypothetical protein